MNYGKPHGSKTAYFVHLVMAYFLHFYGSFGEIGP